MFPIALISCFGVLIDELLQTNKSLSFLQIFVSALVGGTIFTTFWCAILELWNGEVTMNAFQESNSVLETLPKGK